MVGLQKNQVIKAAQATLPLIEILSEKHPDFKGIGDKISSLIIKGLC